MTVKAIPAGLQTVVPYLVVPDAAAQIDFLQRAFDAEVCFQHKTPDGRMLHVQLHLGDSALMMSDARPECAPTQAMFHMYVEDVDAAYAKAVAAGGVAVSPPEDMFYGDRTAGLDDPAGNRWHLSTHKEDVPEDELMRRAAALER
jgi:PhnB protein